MNLDKCWRPEWNLARDAKLAQQLIGALDLEAAGIDQLAPACGRGNRANRDEKTPAQPSVT